jgi:hypothetical protein
MVQKTGKWAVERSGFIISYESRLAAQSHAKSVTNLFTLLSVLGAGVILNHSDEFFSRIFYQGS